MVVDKTLFPEVWEENKKETPTVPQGIDKTLFPEVWETEQQKPVQPVVQSEQKLQMQPWGDLIMPPLVGESTARTLAGGVLKMVEGLVALPFEISESLEPPEKQGKLKAADIRKHFPSIPPQSTKEEIGQILVQYGLPATTSIKLMDKVVRGAPWAIKIASDIVSGGLSDFLVTDPNESTIGDWAGIGPTKRKKVNRPLFHVQK